MHVKYDSFKTAVVSQDRFRCNVFAIYCVVIKLVNHIL